MSPQTGLRRSSGKDMDERTRDAKVRSVGPGESGRAEPDGGGRDSGVELSADQEAVPAVLEVGCGRASPRSCWEAVQSRQGGQISTAGFGPRAEALQWRSR